MVAPAPGPGAPGAGGLDLGQAPPHWSSVSPAARLRPPSGAGVLARHFSRLPDLFSQALKIARRGGAPLNNSECASHGPTWSGSVSK